MKQVSVAEAQIHRRAVCVCLSSCCSYEINDISSDQEISVHAHSVGLWKWKQSDGVDLSWVPFLGCSHISIKIVAYFRYSDKLMVTKFKSRLQFLFDMP